jgi:hypothetical protein
MVIGDMEQDASIYTGPIELISMETQASAENLTIPQFKENNLRIIHYPDCQQLVIMLPAYYTAYKTIEIFKEDGGEIIYQADVNNIISGSVQIIIDSLFIPPGSFTINIIRFDEGLHKIKLRKSTPKPAPEKIPYKGLLYDRYGYIVYRDGFGNILPNEDLELRENLIENLQQELKPDISYFNTGRDGYLIFKEKDKSFRCEMEMGGGNAMFILYIPTAETWEAETGFLISERDRIIKLIAQTTQREQAGGATYLLGDNEIVYFRKLE